MRKKRDKRSYKILAQSLVRCPEHTKKLHRTLDEAKSQAKRYRKKVGSKMAVYHCSVYEGYHIGHVRKHKGRKSGKKKDMFPRIK